MRTMILIINLVCLAFMIFNMVNIAKTDKEMDKMFKKLDEDFIKKMRLLFPILQKKEANEAEKSWEWLQPWITMKW